MTDPWLATGIYRRSIYIELDDKRTVGEFTSVLECFAYADDLLIPFEGNSGLD